MTRFRFSAHTPQQIVSLVHVSRNRQAFPISFPCPDGYVSARGLPNLLNFPRRTFSGRLRPQAPAAALQVFNQRLHLLPFIQFVGVPLSVPKMRGDDGGRVDGVYPKQFGLFPHVLVIQRAGSPNAGSRFSIPEMVSLVPAR